MKCALLAPAIGLTLLATIAFAEESKPIKGDLAKLQGVWIGRTGPDGSIQTVWTIRGDTCSFDNILPEGGRIGGTSKIAFDEEARPHKTINSVILSRYGLVAGGPKRVERVLGIYEFVNNDKINVCNGFGGQRPAEFKSANNGSSMFFSLERKTENEKSRIGAGTARPATALALAQTPAPTTEEPFFEIQEFGILTQQFVSWTALEMESVQEALKISDAQKKELQAITRRRVEEIQKARRENKDLAQFQTARVAIFQKMAVATLASLTSGQRERLEQIRLQALGPFAFAKASPGLLAGTAPSLSEQLKLTDDQTRRCQMIAEQGQVEIANAARFPIKLDTKNGPPTIEAVRSLIDSPKFKADKRKAHQAARDATIAVTRRIEDILTNDQRDAYHKLLGNPIDASKLQWGMQDERQSDLYTVARAVGLSGGGQRADPNFSTQVARPAYADAGQRPRVLFDEAHHNFHTASGRYKPFADMIGSDGYKVIPNRDRFTREVLQKGDVLVIANALGAESMGQPGASDPAFTDAECDAVRDWVKDGGSLLLISDHAPMGAAAECLAKRFDVNMSKGATSDPANSEGGDTSLVFSRQNHLLGDHAITRGRDHSERLSRIRTFTGTSLKGPEGSVAILKLADTAVDHSFDDEKSVPAAGRAQGLAFGFGKGRVVILGEAAELSAQVVGLEAEKFGMNVPGIDNRQMALNIMHWLSGLLEPRENSSKKAG